MGDSFPVFQCPETFLNPRTDGGGGGADIRPPEVFPDSVKTEARSAAKFDMTIRHSLRTLPENFDPIHVKVRSPGHVK